MKKDIKIGKKEVTLSNSAAWLMEYNDQFGRDALADLIPLVESVAETVAMIFADADDNLEIPNVSAVLSAIEGRTMDLMLPLMQSTPSILLINVTWAMAKAADESIDPPKKWIKQFEEFPIDRIAPDVWNLALKGLVSSKNLKRLRTLGAKMKKTPNNLQPSDSTMSSSQDLNED